MTKTLFVCAKKQSSIQSLFKETILVASTKHSKSSRCNILVAGLPNCGKSTIVNSFRQLSSKFNNSKNNNNFKKATKVGNKPGVTRHISAFRVHNTPPTYMFDMPGLMMPSNLNPILGLELAVLGIFNSVFCFL